MKTYLFILLSTILFISFTNIAQAKDRIWAGELTFDLPNGLKLTHGQDAVIDFTWKAPDKGWKTDKMQICAGVNNSKPSCIKTNIPGRYGKKTSYGWIFKFSVVVENVDCLTINTNKDYIVMNSVILDMDRKRFKDRSFSAAMIPILSCTDNINSY